MLIPWLGLFMFLLGSALSFGAWRAFGTGGIKTISMAFIPLTLLSAGFGLIRSKPWARYLTFCLSLFFVSLGIFVFTDVLSLIDFIPVVPLVEYLPTSVLRLNPSYILIALLFVFPLFVMTYLSSKKVAVSFESYLQGHFAWGAPSAVVWAGAFMFSYSLLANAEISSFLGREGRTIFGFSLTPSQGQALRYAEFGLPLVLALSLTGGGWTAWFLVLVITLYFCSPFLLNGRQNVDLKDFKFRFFGVGWVFVALMTLFYWKFFLHPRLWLEGRAVRRPRTGDLLQEGGPPLAQAPEAAPPRGPIRKWWRSVLFSLLFGIIILGIAFYFWSQKGLKAPASKALETIHEAYEETALSKPVFRLEGISIDSQGAYAVVNGNVVQMGAMIQGYRIEVIEPHRVLLSKDEKRYWLDDQGGFAEVG